MANEPTKMADEVAARVVAALTPRLNAIDEQLADLREGQRSHSLELEATRNMLDNDTASFDEIDRIKGKLDRVERRVVKLEKAR